MKTKYEKSIRLQMLVTHRCSARCEFCDKAVGYAKLPQIEMTEEDSRKAVDELLVQNIVVRRLTISGGEPCLNRELQGIVNQVARLNCNIRVLTAGQPITEHLRNKIVFPSRHFEWVISPLDDPLNPKSGKNNRKKKRFHRPYWISPSDIGLEATWEKCEHRGWCGKGLDNNGWSMCGQAPILGPILGIDPYLPLVNGDVFKHVNTAMNEICKHCQYGLNKKERNGIYKEFDKGKLPPISETFKNAFSGKKK